MNRTAAQEVLRSLPRPVAPYWGAERVLNMSVVGRCIPTGSAGRPIAGDFYDVGALDEHRILIAVGDVAGHGVGAAVRMRQLRSATRRLAAQTHSPAQLLRTLDELHTRPVSDDIATLWLGLYDSNTDVLRYASAGHPPPVLAVVGAPPLLLSEASAPPLGTGAVGAHVRVGEIYWPPGALLVAYSDGLVERPSCDLEDQMHLLRELVGRVYAPTLAGDSIGGIAAAILDELVPDPAAAHDDVCILVLRSEPQFVWLDGGNSPNRVQAGQSV